MAVTKQQYGAQSVTYLATGVASFNLGAAQWAELPSGKLKTLMTTEFDSREEAITAWASAGGIFVVSGNYVDSAIITTISLSGGGTGTFVFHVEGIDFEQSIGTVARIAVSYSASE
jgi:hypothetical protein